MTPPLPNIGMRKGRSFTRCGALVQQAAALGEGFVHELDVALLEVAQAAVDELRRLRRRARREVVAFDQRDRQAAGRRVECDAGSGDAAADDDEVEGPRAETVERGGAVESCKGHRTIVGRRSYPWVTTYQQLLQIRSRPN